MEKSFDERLTEAKAAVSSVSPQEANERKVNDPEVIFLDPRNEEDILSSTGIIPGALNVTLGELSDSPDTALPRELSDQSRTIITACQAGPMGALAAHALKQRGYRDVVFMDGGTQGWLDAGYSTTH